MPRNYKSTEVYLKPDPRYGSELASKIINKLMLKGKKSVAQRLLYDAVDIVAKKTEKEPLEIIDQAIDNIRPRVEVRSKRVGGATYQVPHEVSRKRQQTMAIRWLIDMARSKRLQQPGRRGHKEREHPQDGRGEQRLQPLRLVADRSRHNAQPSRVGRPRPRDPTLAKSPRQLPPTGPCP